jgi:hypothetical protein
MHVPTAAWSPPRSRPNRPALRRAGPIALLATVLLVLTAVLAGRAEAQTVYWSQYPGTFSNREHYVPNPTGGLPTTVHWDLRPYQGQIAAWGAPGSTGWYQSVGSQGEYKGPKGLMYRMYKNSGNGQCLDVKQGAATAGAELTTAPCEWGRYSQWWAVTTEYTYGQYGYGKLIPWHAAYQNLVAHTIAPGGWGLYHLVLAPASGGDENQNQFYIWRAGAGPPH